MIEEILDEKLRAKRDSEKQPDCFRISGMGGCLRKRFLERKGDTKEELDARTLRVFQVGNIYHTYLQEILKDKLIGSEIEVKQGDFVGHIDAILKGDNGNTLIDFKTVNSRKFTYLGKEADRHYIMQLLTYTMLAEKEYNITESKIVYVSKDDFRMREMTYRLNNDWREEIASEVEELQRYWQSKKLPPPEPQASWNCQYCQFTQCPSNKLNKK